ncbi:subunit of tubulin prefoldin [Knufia obscura]|uniref:Subunit of tubulin prefoldin n=2 Tax=Knufia TaxID=430999 RepID=A0AAN8I4P6_9EURO|nr:subunit of tubulin prefoldin [Knufia obscura]KAK5951979.1 subunit of tubulin prefoldin [Knufia fluminis]
MSTQQQQQQGLDITTLPVQQLSQLQQRLSQELEHLSNSHARLRAAQARFKDCIRSIRDGVEGRKENTPLLIPLTTSLYVPARPTISSHPTVLVDVGTGYFVSKRTPDAIKFYNGKVDDLTRNLGDIERAVGTKNGDLRMVEEVLRGKVLSEQQGGGQGQKKEGD